MVSVPEDKADLPGARPGLLSLTLSGHSFGKAFTAYAGIKVMEQ